MNDLPPAPARDRRHGQTLVEFALVVPLFVLLLFGLIDVGRAVYLNTVVSQAAREAARTVAVEAAWVGSTDPACNKPSGPVCPASIDVLKSDAIAAANRMVTPYGLVVTGRLFMSCDPVGSAPTGNWTAQSCSSRGTGNVVSIRVKLRFDALTPLIGQLVSPMDLSGAATMVIN